MSRQDDFGDEIRRARKGDREALDRLLRRFEGRLAHLADESLGRSMRARLRGSDVLQNAYLEVVADFGSFRGNTEGEFLAWARSVLFNALRRQFRVMNAKKRVEPEATAELRALASLLAPRVPSPSSAALAQEDREILERALNRLSEDHRFVIRSILLEGREHAEVAVLMGRSNSATRMLLSRARAALSLELESLDGDRCG